MSTPNTLGKSLHLTIITPARAVYDADAAGLIAPAFDGEVGVLPGHAPMLALLGNGELRVNETNGKTRHLAIRGGFMQVNDNKVTVLTPESFGPEDLKPEDLAAESEKLNALKPVQVEELDALAGQKAWLLIKQKVRATK